MNTYQVFCLDDVQKIKDKIAAHGAIMRRLRDKLKDESLSLEEQNETRKMVIELLSEDLLLIGQLSNMW